MPTLIGQTIGRIASLIGYDGTNFRPLKLNSDGRIESAPAYNGTVFVPVQVDTDNRIQNKPGYDGSTYAPLLIDASRHVKADIVTDARRAADSKIRWWNDTQGNSGDVTGNAGAVGSTELIIAEHICVQIISGSATRISVAIYAGGNNYYLGTILSPGVYQTLIIANPITLFPTEEIHGLAYGVSNGTWLRTQVYGYKMHTAS